jgi:hypothetical protein
LVLDALKREEGKTTNLPPEGKASSPSTTCNSPLATRERRIERALHVASLVENRTGAERQEACRHAAIPFSASEQFIS